MHENNNINQISYTNNKMQIVPEKNFDNKIIGKQEGNTLNVKDYENIQGVINYNINNKKESNKKDKNLDNDVNKIVDHTYMHENYNINQICDISNKIQFVKETNCDDKIIGMNDDNTLNYKDYDNNQGVINNNNNNKLTESNKKDQKLDNDINKIVDNTYKHENNNINRLPDNSNKMQFVQDTIYDDKIIGKQDDKLIFDKDYDNNQVDINNNSNKLTESKKKTTNR